MPNTDRLIELQRQRREAVKQGAILTKQCLVCMEAKPITEFALSTGTDDGLASECVVCQHMEGAQRIINERVLQDQPTIRTEPTPVLGGFTSPREEEVSARASRKYQFLFKYKRRWAKAVMDGIELVKTCPTCRVSKSIYAFEIDAYESDALKAECMACIADKELMARELAARAESVDQAVQDIMEEARDVNWHVGLT